MTNTNETLAQLAQNPRANRKKLNELARATLRSITSSELELLVALADHGHWCVLVQPKDAVDAAALMANGLVLRDEETEHRVIVPLMSTKQTYLWRTDSGSGSMQATSAKEVLSHLIANDWWWSGAQRDGGWLVIQADGATEPEITFGEEP